MNKTIYLILLTGLFLSACSDPVDSPSLLGEWKLISYGPPDFPLPAVSGVDASITFNEDGTLSGNLGCNHFGGGYKQKGDQIIFDALAATLMACPDPQMSQEQAAFLVLSDSAVFTIEENTLTLVHGGNALVFERLQQAVP